MDSLTFTGSILAGKRVALSKYGVAVTRRLDRLKEINQEPDKWRCTDKLESGIFVFQSNPPKGGIISIPIKPRYHVDQVVYLKEAWVDYCPIWYGYWCGHGRKEDMVREHRPVYRSDPETEWLRPMNDKGDMAAPTEWKAPLFMPAWAARHFVQITNVRPERLHDIGGDGGFGDLNELHKEGLLYGECWVRGSAKLPMRYDSINAFTDLWDSCSKKYPWSSNPWVFRNEFKEVERP